MFLEVVLIPFSILVIVVSASVEKRSVAKISRSVE